MTSTYPSSSRMAPFLRSPAQKKTKDVDVNSITRSVLLDGNEHVVSHEGTSQYNREGSGASACGLASLNFARVAFLKEQDGLCDEALLQAVLSRECAEETTAVCALWSGNLHLEVEDICRVPVFEKTLKLKTTTYGRPGVNHFKSLLTDLTNLETSAAVIITRPPEIIACLKLRLSTRNVFIIFDSHPRPSYPKGAGAIVSTSVEGTARRLTELLPSVDLQDGILQWQAQLLSNCSGHVFLPHSLDPSTTALWQAVLEASLAQLSLQAEISELRSQNEFQVSEQKRLESELKEVEERSQRQEKTIQELRSSPSKTFSHRTANPEWRSPSSTSRPFSPNNPFLNSNLIRNNATTHSTSPPSAGPHDTRGNPPGTLFDRDDSLSYAMRLQGEFDSEDRALSAERNTLTRYATTSSSTDPRFAGPRDTRGDRSAPLFNRDDRLPYARRLHGEFDNGDRAPYAERHTRYTITSPSTGSRSTGPLDTRWDQPPYNRDDRLPDSRRLQGEFDSRDRGLSVEHDTPIGYTITSHFPASQSAGQHNTRGNPRGLPFNRDEDLSYAERLRNEFDHEDRALAAERVNLPHTGPLSYAERLQKEFDNEDRALSEERIKLSHTVQQVFQCGICMEEMPEDSVARPDPCKHSFCRDCMRGYVSSRLEEHRFPILCPSCTASKGKGKSVTGEISQALALNLGLTDEQFSIWTEMEMVSFSVLLHCRKCTRSMFVARDEHDEAKIIACPLPDCNHAWCKQCQQTIDFGGPQHSCDGTKELDHLMKEQGWKYCPSCKTPIQKVSGCNHMSCMTPACNTHFCYLCGGLIVKSALGQDIKEATSSHFRSNCALFEVPGE